MTWITIINITTRWLSMICLLSHESKEINLFMVFDNMSLLFFLRFSLVVFSYYNRFLKKLLMANLSSILNNEIGFFSLDSTMLAWLFLQYFILKNLPFPLKFITKASYKLLTILWFPNFYFHRSYYKSFVHSSSNFQVFVINHGIFYFNKMLKCT